MRELAAQIAHEADALGAQLAEFVLEEVPAYRGLDRDEVREVTVVSGRVNVGAIFSMLQFGIPPETIRQPAGAVDFAHTMIHRGIDLATILRTYRLGHDRLWDTWIAFIAQRIDDPGAAGGGDAPIVGAHVRVLRRGRRRTSPPTTTSSASAGCAVPPPCGMRRWSRLLAGADLDAEQAGLASAPRVAPPPRRVHRLERGRPSRGRRLPVSAELVAGAVAAALEAGPPLVVRPERDGALGVGVALRRRSCGPGRAPGRSRRRGAARCRRLAGLGTRGVPRVACAGARGPAGRAPGGVTPPASRPTRRSPWRRRCAPTSTSRGGSRGRSSGALDAPTPSAARLRETLTAYFEEGNSPVRAARRLGVHEKTVVYRVRKAEEVLGHAVGGRRAELELALRVRLLLSEPT